MIAAKMGQMMACSLLLLLESPGLLDNDDAFDDAPSPCSHSVGRMGCLDLDDDDSVPGDEEVPGADGSWLGKSGFVDSSIVIVSLQAN